LTDVIAILAIGQPAPAITQSESVEELDKRLHAALLRGDVIISIDNCDHVLASGALSHALTGEQMSIRLLGYSRNITVETKATFLANGNNLIISNDLVRRSLLCRMDAKQPYPELRAFKSNVLEETRNQRGKLVCAALTILRAWHISGAAVDVKPLGSFELWSTRVRKPLLWLDQADPCGNSAMIREDDPVRMTLMQVLTEWGRKLVIGDPYKIKDVIARAVVDADFFAVLMEIAGARQGNRISPDRLGRYLAKNNGKIVEFPSSNLTKPFTRLKLEKYGIKDGYPLWKVVEL
jgi:putative DNA primase/helicase